MTRRKFRKRSRQKTLLHEIRTSFRENARLMMQRHIPVDTGDKDTMEEAGASDPHQRSPESVLFEPQELVDPHGKLSPKIRAKPPKTRLDYAEDRENDNAEIESRIVARKIESQPVDLPLCRANLGHEAVPEPTTVKLLYPAKVRGKDVADEADEGEIAARKIERSNSSSSVKVDAVSDLLDSENYSEGPIAVRSSLGDPFNFTDDCSSYLSSLKHELNGGVNKTVGVTRNDQQCSPDAYDTGLFLSTSAHELSRQNVSRPATYRFNVESRDVEHVRRPPSEKRSSQQSDDCYLLDKTLSINDDLIREINSYLDERSSTVINDHRSAVGVTTSPIAATCKYHKSGSCESLIRGTINGHDGSYTDNPNENRKEKPNNDKSHDAAAEKIGEYLAANWREFQRIFAYVLRRIDGKARGEDAERNASPLSGYKSFADVRGFRHVPVSTFCTLVSRVSSLSPSRDRGSSATGRDVARSSVANERARKPDGSPRGTRETVSRIDLAITKQGSAATWGESSQRLAKRPRFENEDEEAKEKGRQPAATNRARITDPLVPEGRKSEERSVLPPDLPERDKARWTSRTSLKSTSTSLLTDYEDCSYSSRKVDYWNDTYKCRTSQTGATLQDSQDHLLPRRNIPRAVIARVAAACVWLMQKLLHLLNSGYKKLRSIIVSSLSGAIPKRSPRSEEIGRLVVTLHSDNERMLCALSEKVTRLSADFVQIRTSAEATLGVLTAEMNNVREVSRKMNENNLVLTQELKKLHETLEEIQLKSVRSAPSASSRPPPPPLPPPPSLLIPPQPPSLSSPSLLFPPKAPTSKSASPMRLPPPPPPPPPPPFPLVSIQSSMPPILPTTPNSSRGNRSIVTPTRKCSTPLLNRPSITVEDLLKVTLKKAPQSIKDNRRNTVPGPRGPVVSLDMLRSVKLKSARRRINDQTGRSPRSGRIIKSRIAPGLSLSPIMTGSESNLERILRQADRNRRGPRRLLSGTANFRDHDSTMDETQNRSLEKLKHSQSQSAIA